MQYFVRVQTDMYMCTREANVLLFRRPLGTDPRTGAVPSLKTNRKHTLDMPLDVAAAERGCGANWAFTLTKDPVLVAADHGTCAS